MTITAHTPHRHTIGQIMVTGVCGFIGSHVAEALATRDGVRVIGVDRREPQDDPRTADAIADLMAKGRFEFVRSEVGDDLVADLLDDTAAVVHLAAPTDIAASWGQGFTDQAASLLGTQRLLSACTEAGVPRLVVASSAHVYGPVDGLACETVPAEPSSPYGVAKLATERMTTAYARKPGSMTSAVALRLFTAFGPRANPAMVVHRMFRSAESGRAMSLFGDGSAAHTWTYIDDLVDAVLHAIDLPMDAGQAEVVNVAGAEQASLREVGELVGKVVGSPVRWEQAEQRPGDATGTRADLTRARQVLGFTPRIGIREGLESLWEQLQSQNDPYGLEAAR